MRAKVQLPVVLAMVQPPRLAGHAALSQLTPAASATASARAKLGGGAHGSTGLPSGLRAPTRLQDWSTVDGTRAKLDGQVELKRVSLSLPTTIERERCSRLPRCGSRQHHLPSKLQGPTLSTPPPPAAPCCCTCAAQAVPHGAGAPDSNGTLSGADDPHKHPCALVIDGSCHGFWAQSGGPPHKPYPQGAKPCASDCNRVGQCNYDLGECQCPAGESAGEVALSSSNRVERQGARLATALSCNNLSVQALGARTAPRRSSGRARTAAGSPATPTACPL